jgi:hypothetical protein
MIFYRLAKGMEERARLQGSIRQSEGDVSFLQQKKERLEEELWVEASRWLQMAPSLPAAQGDVLPELTPIDVLTEPGQQASL